MKKVNLPAGKYVVAVSGGVDSMILLDMLVQQPALDLIVAHFDHAMRPDSASDCDFVAKAAKSYSLPFVSQRAKTGQLHSEADARTARYAFLDSVMAEHQAQAVVTAHHQDDVIETMLINLIRGTGWRGLIALTNTATRQRPLLNLTKTQLKDYAEQHNLSWREDSTNQDRRYLRNQLRHDWLPRLDRIDPDWRTSLLALRAQLQQLEPAINQTVTELQDWLHTNPTTLDRDRFTSLPHPLARELLAAELRQQDQTNLTTQRLEQLVHFAKTARNGKSFDYAANLRLRTNPHQLDLVLSDKLV